MATKLFKTLKKKAGRLQDIISVLQKLEEKKYVERLCNLFEEIFYEEQKFTITGNILLTVIITCLWKMFCILENSKINQIDNPQIKKLQRIMSSKPANKYLDLDEQFKQNTQLFKVNFEAITNILINEAWDSVSSNFIKGSEDKSQVKQNGDYLDRSRPSTSPQQQYDASQPQSQYQSVTQEHMGNEGEQHHVQQIYKSQSYEQQNGNNNNVINNDSKILNKIGLAKSQLMNNSSYSMNTSYTQSNHNENWVRNNMKKRNSSRSQDNSQQLGSPVNDSQYAKRMTSLNNSTVNRTNQSILDIKRQSEKKLNNMNLSVSSVKSLSQSKLGIPPPFSEFPENKNPLSTSFNRAPKNLFNKEMSQSPGPMDYNIDKADKLLRRQSPKASFGSTQRTNFVDEKYRKESSSTTPGPQYNTSQANIYKPMKK